MPEGTEGTETVAPETAAPEAAPEPAAPEASHPTGVREQGEEQAATEEAAPPPDLTDAMAQLNARLDRAGVPPAQEEETLGPLLGQTEDDFYDDEGQQVEQQQQGQLSEEDAQAQQVQQLLDQAVDARLQPVLWQQEMNRRVEAVQSFAQQNPQITKPEVMQRVEAELAVLDPNFGQQGYAPDPRVLAIAYRSAQAELATNGSQTSTPPAGGEQGTAEAVGQQGATLETGAGPSAPPAELSPEEQAYAQALNPGSTLNRFGF